MLDEAWLIEVTVGRARGIRLVGMRALTDLLRMPMLGRVATCPPIGADAGLADTLTLDILRTGLKCLRAPNKMKKELPEYPVTC